jgi:hypothetical protein
VVPEYLIGVEDVYLFKALEQDQHESVEEILIVDNLVVHLRQDLIRARGVEVHLRALDPVHDQLHHLHKVLIQFLQLRAELVLLLLLLIIILVVVIVPHRLLA